MRSLKLETISGTMEFTNIVEYAFGFKYLFVRRSKNENENEIENANINEHETISVERSSIKEAYRKYKDRWIKINMKVPRKKREDV